MSGVIRTSCKTGWPLPEPDERPSRDPVPPAPPPGAVVCPPNPDVPLLPDPPCEPNPFVVEVEDALPFSETLPFCERRSPPLEVEDAPDPGAIWLSALSSNPEDEPPMNMSVSTRAIWRASPYFTR